MAKEHKMSNNTTTTRTSKPADTNKYRINGHYNINDVKFDLLKIIQPHDGYMYNEKDVSMIRTLFVSYLNDLRYSYKIFGFQIESMEKQNAYTFDIQVQMQRERSPKKLKIHVGKLVHPMGVTNA